MYIKTRCQRLKVVQTEEKEGRREGGNNSDTVLLLIRNLTPGATVATTYHLWARCLMGFDWL